MAQSKDSMIAEAIEESMRYLSKLEQIAIESPNMSELSKEVEAEEAAEAEAPGAAVATTPKKSSMAAEFQTPEAKKGKFSMTPLKDLNSSPSKSGKLVPPSPDGPPLTFSTANIIGLYRQETEADDLEITLEDLHYFVGYKLMRYVSSFHERYKLDNKVTSDYLALLIKHKGANTTDMMYQTLIPKLIDMNAYACKVIFKSLLEWRPTCECDVTLYRGLSTPRTPYDATCLETITSCVPGSRIRFPSCTSTSLNIEVGKKFAGVGGILLVIRLPQGDPFTYISDAGSEEEEVLLIADCELIFEKQGKEEDKDAYYFTYQGPTMGQDEFDAIMDSNADRMKEHYKLRRSDRLRKGGKRRRKSKRTKKVKRVKRLSRKL